jgi:hypothetical protein
MRIAHPSPANANEQSTGTQKDTGAKAINQPTFNRGDPGFKKNKKGEGPLDGG